MGMTGSGLSARTTSVADAGEIVPSEVRHTATRDRTAPVHGRLPDSVFRSPFGYLRVIT